MVQKWHRQFFSKFCEHINHLLTTISLLIAVVLYECPLMIFFETFEKKLQTMGAHNMPCLMFIYSEKATKFCEISTVDLTVTAYVGQIYGGDIATF